MYGRTKYYSVKKICGHGHSHDSKLEAERCDELHLLLSAGEISSLEIQKRMMIVPPFYEEEILDEVYKSGKNKGQHKVKRRCIERPVYYVADFVYHDNRSGKNVIEDSKGMKTTDYIIKRKLVRQQYCGQGTDTIFIESRKK